MVAVEVKFFPSIDLYYKTAGVPITEYPYRLNGAVPNKSKRGVKFIFYQFPFHHRRRLYNFYLPYIEEILK